MFHLLLAATSAALLQPGLLSLPRVCRAPLALVRASLSEAESSEVEALLEERDAMRRERDYAAADEIREELRSRFRVIVDDRQKSWWVDDDSSSNGRRRRGDRGGDRYAQSGRGGSDGDTADIEAMLQERDDLRRSRDFNGADAIRDELREQYNVVIDDREKSWWVDSGASRERGRRGGGGGRGGRGGYDSHGATDDVAAEVEQLLEERDALRRERDYARADEILETLRFEHGVVVDDREKTWWVDGSATAGGTRSKRQAAAPRAFREFGPAGHDYSRAEDDGAELNDEEAEAVDDLLRRRLQAKLARRFEEADELLEELRDMGVQVNDGRKAWRADGGSFDVAPYRQVGGALREGLDAEVVASLVAQRVAAKREREYALADSIHAELTEMGVYVDDDRRTWSGDNAGGYTREGPPSPTIDDADVAKLLAERAVAKRRRNYQTADELQAQVRGMGVELDNREMTWRYL